MCTGHVLPDTRDKLRDPSEALSCRFMSFLHVERDRRTDPTLARKYKASRAGADKLRLRPRRRRDERVPLGNPEQGNSEETEDAHRAAMTSACQPSRG